MESLSLARGRPGGPAEAGKQSIFIHDNTFIPNDLFTSADSRRGVTSTVCVERNTFKLVADPVPTEGHTPFRSLGGDFEASIKAGKNKFEGMGP